jgi:EAL domain-containing protein (putative c-di-GMP-specific phosphodiesterase class I)/FixJ family two-component response regulator
MPLSPNTARILLLDDDPFMLKLLRRQLAELSYTQVDAFDSGQKALEQLNSSKALYDLILLDINMPEMDGVEFIRQLVQCRYSGSVILVSGEAGRILESVERLIEAHRLTALGHLQKPVKPEDLATLIGRLKANIGPSIASGETQAPYSAEQLRAAINNGELVSHYQPKVALGTSEVVGVESLVRWQHPVNGLIFPDQFIEVAESHGLITEVTRVVLTTAMQQAKAWAQSGHHLPIAVNVSMDDLTALDFPDVAASLARTAGIDPSLITLEVTEGQMMRNLSTILDVLSRLSLKRFRLAIDDFGTGHSSLAQLRDLPFDELKVDRGFVHGAPTDETRSAICGASILMAHQLQMQAVGEGIENREDWEFLRLRGCDVGQGYFIARPMPASDVVGWVDAWYARRGVASPLKA